MIIKSLYIENIRSYKTQEFLFQEGMTLLSGDIGSGKSTVLLGIEFAIFGLIRGSINGSALLRHGAKEGLVRIKFSIDNKDYEIERSIKRTSSGIVQDKCSFKTNIETEQLTPIELKSRVLKLLGYPDDLVTKSKTLIFRYTVYTPQEEMKQIIFESKEERLEKLRRIFGVDKYELIKNNASNYARDLRADIRMLKPMLEESQLLQEQIKNIRTELNLIHEERDEVLIKHKEVVNEELLIKEKYKTLEESTKLFNELKSQKNVLINDIRNVTKNVEDIDREIFRIRKDIELREGKIEKLPEIKKSIDDIQKEILELNVKREEFEKKASDAKNKDAIIKNKLIEINELLMSVDELENCPTCKQEVTDEHKVSLREKEREKLSMLNDKLAKIKEILTKIDDAKKKFDEKKKLLEEERDEIKTNIFKKKLLDENLKVINEKKEQLKINEKRIDESKKTIDVKNKEVLHLQEKIDKFKTLEDEIRKVREDLELATKKNIAYEKKLSTFEQAIKDKDRQIKEKNEDLIKKEKSLKLLDDKRILEQWLSNHFINLAGIIEKHTLTKLHFEFNNLFREWFSMLIEDSELDANIEQDFSVSIIQNGYDASIDNLSGGEKTAVSLAYRLALNKVINDLVHDVKTKGFMILDEPTDGFSSEQLDKVRDVLDKTNTKQIIIVSHEAKLESFVQNIIRINKNNHESSIVQM